MIRSHHPLVSTLMIALLVSVVQGGLAEVRYEMTDSRTFDGGGEAYAINDIG